MCLILSVSLPSSRSPFYPVRECLDKLLALRLHLSTQHQTLPNKANKKKQMSDSGVNSVDALSLSANLNSIPGYPRPPGPRPRNEKKTRLLG